MKKEARVAKTDSEKAEHWFQQAIVAFRCDDLTKAQKACRKAVELAPDIGNYWYGLADVCDELDDKTEAIEAYRAVIRLEPRNHWAANRLGVMMLDGGNAEDAVPAFRQALQFAPHDDVYWSNLATACSEAGDVAESADAFQHAAALKPKNLYYARMAADALHELEDWDGAAEAYRHALKLQPRDHLRWYNLGAALNDTDKYPEAVKALREAVRLRPDIHSYWNALGNAAHSAGRLDEAVRAYRHAVRLKPGNTAYLQSLGELCTETNRLGEAVRAFRRAVVGNMKKYAASSHLIDRPQQRKTSPQVMSATVDLKLTPEGKIKICEFNDLWSSGFEGFKCVTGEDMHENIVKPFYGQLAQSLRLQGLPVDKIRPREGDNDEDLLGLFSDARRKRPRTVAANADPGFQALCVYKDYLSAVIPNHLRDYTPHTVVAPLSESAPGDVIGGSNGLTIIKPADALQGRGVEVVSPDEVPARVAQISAIYNKASAGTGQYWADNIHPNVLVQSCEQSVLVPAADGKFYDGTMRVAFTAVFMPGVTTPDIHFHGAYWKLPEEPAGGGRESIVSFSPSAHVNGNAEEVFAAKPFAATVSPDHRQMAERQLTSFLQELLPAAVAGSQVFLNRVTGLLDSEQEWKRALGTRLATDHGFGNLLAREGGKKASAALLTKMKYNEDAHPGDSAARYLKQIFSAPRHPHTIRECLLSSDVAEYLKKKSHAALELRQLALATPV